MFKSELETAFAEFEVELAVINEKLKLVEAYGDERITQLAFHLFHLMSVLTEKSLLNLFEFNVVVGTYIVAHQHLQTIFEFVENPTVESVKKMELLLSLQIHEVLELQPSFKQLILQAHSTLKIPGSYNISDE